MKLITIQNSKLSKTTLVQVTATSFTSQDALASSSVRLTVEIAPESVTIEYNHVTVETGHLAVTEGVMETVTCVTRHSNPAPVITWFLGDKQLSQTSVTQSNVTERQMTDRWRSEAVLTHKFGIKDTGADLRCRVSHAGYIPNGLKMYQPV